MRRGPVVVLAAAAGLAGVLGFHSNRPSVFAAPKTGTRPPSQPQPSGAPAGGSRSAVGATEQYGYGELAVRVMLSGGRITNVAITALRTAESYSQSLAQQVIPMLRREVLAAQSAHINGVSGATYTSEAYAYSVQAALDRLHVS
jgi:uncharacterized protein with FMN-binding domain